MGTPSVPRWKGQRHLITAVRIAAGVLPFIWIFGSTDIEKLTHAIKHVAWWTIPFTVASSLLVLSLQGIRIWVLLRSQTASLSLAHVMKCHFVSGFYSIALPTSTAHEVVRAAMLAQRAGSSLSWGGAWINRIISLVIWLCMSAYGLLAIDRAILPREVYVVVTASLAVVVLLVLMSLSKRVTRPMRRPLARLLPERAMSVGEGIRNAVYEFRSHKSSVAACAAVTFGVQFILVAGSALVIYGISGILILKECFAFLPIIEIICVAVPLTPNSMGIREGLWAVMFGITGLSKEILATYIVLGFIVLFIRLLGGIPVFASSYRSVRNNR